MSLGEILCELREEQNLTQVELAEKLHISNSCISAYETGIRQPGLGTVLNYSDFFHVSTDYLLGKTTEPSFPRLSEQFIDDVSVGAVMNMICSLLPEQKTALFAVIRSFYAEVEREREGSREKEK